MKKRALLLLPLCVTLLGGCNLGAVIGGDSTSQNTTILPTSTSIAPQPSFWTLKEENFFREHFFHEDIVPHAYSLKLDIRDSFCLAIDDSNTSDEKVYSYCALLREYGYREFQMTPEANPYNDFFIARSFAKDLGQFTTYDSTITNVEMVLCVGAINGIFSLMFTKNYYMVPMSNYFCSTQTEFEELQAMSIEYMTHYAVNPQEIADGPALRANDMLFIDVEEDFDFKFSCMSYRRPFGSGNSMTNDVYETVEFEIQKGRQDIFDTVTDFIHLNNYSIDHEFDTPEFYEIFSVKDTYLGVWYIYFYCNKVDGVPSGKMTYRFYFDSTNKLFPQF